MQVLALGMTLKTQLGMPICHLRGPGLGIPALLQSYPPAKVHHGQGQGVAQVFESMLPVDGSVNPSLGPAQPRALACV